LQTLKPSENEEHKQSCVKTGGLFETSGTSRWSHSEVYALHLQFLALKMCEIQCIVSAGTEMGISNENNPSLQ
jgi:hypothetical protein